MLILTLNASIVIFYIMLLSEINTALEAIMELLDLTLKIISTINLSFQAIMAYRLILKLYRLNYVSHCS